MSHHLRLMAIPALFVTMALPMAAMAQYTSSNRDVLTPNTGIWPSGGITLGGTRFINLGLQGVGRVAANSIDQATGESLGSISGLQISGFTNNGNGSWSGTFNALPDRGYNSGAIFSNYAARINNFNFSFTPYTGTAATAAQNQIALSFTGSTRFTTTTIATRLRRRFTPPACCPRLPAAPSSARSCRLLRWPPNKLTARSVTG